MKERLIAGFIGLSVELAFLGMPVLLVSAIFMAQSIKCGDFDTFGIFACMLGVGLDVVYHLIDATLDYMLEEK